MNDPATGAQYRLRAELAYSADGRRRTLICYSRFPRPTDRRHHGSRRSGRPGTVELQSGPGLHQPASDSGWSWSHEQSFLSVRKELPWVDLSIRKDSVPDDNRQAVEDLLESMVQQGARVIFTTWFGFIEPTRAVAKRHLDVAFYQESGSLIRPIQKISATTSRPSRRAAPSVARSRPGG